MTTPRTKKIEELQQRLARLQAEQRKAAARARASASKACRAQETRRKILLGAFLLEQLGGASGVADLSVQGKRFDSWLTRPDDRSLFGLLPPSPASPATPAPPGAGVSAAGAAPYAGGGSE
ncbi:mobilization protein [Acidovorax sp. Q11]